MNIKDFLEIPKRKIMLTNKVSVGNTILRDLNINKNVDVIDVKVLKVSDIAQELIYAYDAYEGREARTILDTDSAHKYMERAITKEDLGSFPKALLTDSTVIDVYKCANEIRLNEVTNEWKNSTDIKVKDLKQIIDSYENLIAKDNSLDQAMLIIEAIKIATENASLISLLLPWKKKTYIGSLEVNAFTEAEKKLVELIAADEYCDIEFLNQDITNNGKVNYSFYKAYGMVNEINHVVNAIKESNNPSATAIYYSVPAYVNFIKAAMDNAKIPYKITSGNPATETDMMQFMLGLLNTAKENFLYKNLKPVIENRLITFYNVATDEVRLNPISGYNEALGHGIGWSYERYIQYIDITRKDCDRLESDPNSSDYHKKDIPLRREFALFLERFIDIFYENTNKGYECRRITDMFKKLMDFTDLYTFKSNTDKLKLKKPMVELEKKLRLVDDTAFSLEENVEYISNMLKELSFEEEAEGNAVLVSSINGFMAIDRSEIFVIGLNANSFSLDTKQSPVLLDDEKKKYIQSASSNDIKSVIDLSTNRNPRRKFEMENSFRTIDHGNVCLLYSYYDTISLRESSPSVFYIEMSSNSEVKVANGYVEDNYLKNNITNKTGSVRVDAEELKQALEESNAKIVAKKEEKAKKKEKRQQEWKEKKIAFYDVEGGELEPSYEKETQEDEDVVKENEDSIEDNENAKETTSNKRKETYISSTGIQTLLGCPIMYYYNYTNHLRFYEELENTGYEWIDKLNKGNLCHRVMEKYMREAFPPAKPLSNVIDKALFDDIYAKEIAYLETQIPAPSQAIKNREEKSYKEIIKSYIEKVHTDWVNDSNNGKDYEVIGCEIDFNKLVYEYQKDGEFDFRLVLTGSIDRVDGYVDNDGILQLRIIDYKTGKKGNKDEEVKEDVQIQHYTYGMAALAHIKKYLEENDYVFAGKKVEDINFEQVAYLFPYVESDGTDDYDILDVTNEVLACFKTDGKNIDGKISLPESVNGIISKTIGAMQNDDLNALASNSEAIINEKIDKKIADIRAANYEKEKAAAEEKFNDSVILGTNKTATFDFKLEDVKADYTIENFCKDKYCKYKNICRKWMGGNK